MSRSSRGILTLLIIVLLAFLLSKIVKQKVGFPSKVVDQSMLPSLQDGQRILINKFSAPARTDLAVYQLEDSEEATMYLKRVVGVPGDTIEIIQQKTFINGEEISNRPLLFNYLVQTTEVELSGDQLLKLDLTQGGKVNTNNLYRFACTDSVSALIAEEPNVIRVEKALGAKGFLHKGLLEFAQSPEDLRWNKDQFGPLYCPKKSDELLLSDQVINLYAKLLEKYEGKQIKKVDELFYVNNNLAEKVAFDNDYYFVLGDNRHYSKDSRKHGLIPKKMIVGKAIPL